jgi:hypothetical protein
MCYLDGMKKAVAFYLAALSGVLVAQVHCNDTPKNSAASAAAPASAASTVAAQVSVTAAASLTAATAPPTAVETTPALDAGAHTCGDKPLPPCPMQGWMKGRMATAFAAKDYPTLEAQFLGLAKDAPDPAQFSNWRSIAKDGAQAAKLRSYEGIKAACKGCHDQYKTSFAADYGRRSKALASGSPWLTGAP